MTVTTRNKILLLKQNREDFEWYPTTAEMVQVVCCNCGEMSSILDIGAGDGRVLEQIAKLWPNHLDKYAIEKAITHLEDMPPDISIVGTDFRSQTLIDKKVDVVFCNPPYSEYEEWAVKIIKEANAKVVFLVIPERWANSVSIQQSIKQRGATNKVIWSGDFMEADRRARARVDILKIHITDATGDWEREDTDPFGVWFNEYFSGFEMLNHADEEPEGNSPERPCELVGGQNLVERLSNLYSKEMSSLLDNYKTLSNLDTSLLRELGINSDEIKKALRLKINGLKNRYWKELFDNLDKITNRLTNKSRNEMLEKLRASCNVDFSVDNAYAIVLWAIKNANKYFEQQLVEVFKELSEPACVKNYKSNMKTWDKNGWRYRQKDHTRYTLDYRIVTQQYTAIGDDNSFRKWEYPNNLSKSAHTFINDIFTIANNLGFSNIESSLNRYWYSNNEQEFFSNGKTLVTIRAFKNGNLHLKFDQDFIKTLNIEASRLLGWIRSSQEAADEMGIDVNFVKSKLNSNLLFGISEGRKFLAG